GQDVRVFDGASGDEVISVTAPSDDTVRLAIRDPAASITVPQDDPDVSYLDINGDGQINQLDIDALAFDLAHAQAQPLWQNPDLRWDVTGDGYVAPNDAAYLISILNG